MIYPPIDKVNNKFFKDFDNFFNLVLAFVENLEYNSKYLNDMRGTPMNRHYKMSVALDVDDLLLECIPYAIKLSNEKYHITPPISIHEVDRWGHLGSRADVIFEYFKDPKFYEDQPVISGAKEFVRKLTQIAEVFISTSIPPEFMGIRAKRIMEEFPEIPVENIYMGSRKDKINVDVLFDDGMHNVFKSNAKYPILMRRPWNQDATGMLAVNNYDEFLKLLEVIIKSNSSLEDPVLNHPCIVCLVGPSGSGKTKVASKLITMTDQLEKLQSYTTKDPTSLKENDWYNYVSHEEFRNMLDDHSFFESTMYAGHGFGSKKEDVLNIFKTGKNVLTTMDICGAMTLKCHFDNVVTIYIKRDRKTLIESILKKNSTIEDKTNRILAIDSEKSNIPLCDYVVYNNSYDEAAQEILDILKIK